MKHLLFIVLVSYFIIGCSKSDPVDKNNNDILIFLSGRIVDAKSQAPIQGTSIRAEQFGIAFPSGEYYYSSLSKNTTDEYGRFNLSFEASSYSTMDYINLRMDSVPDGYQLGARINGQYCRVLAKEWFRSEEAFLVSGQEYLVELIPLTKAFFNKPIVPTGWGNDTLDLHIENLVPSPGSLGWELANFNTQFEFKLNNTQKWLDLKKVRNLNLGDQLDIKYVIKNGQVKKSGNFSVICAIGDTTAVDLPLW
jgi:hypothetical protein